MTNERDKLSLPRGASGRLPVPSKAGVASDQVQRLRKPWHSFYDSSVQSRKSSVLRRLSDPEPKDNFKSLLPIYQANVVSSDDELAESLRQYQGKSDSIIDYMLNHDDRSALPAIINQHSEDGFNFVRNITYVYEEGRQLTSNSINDMLVSIHTDHELLNFCYSRLEDQPTELPSVLLHPDQRFALLERYVRQFGAEGLAQYAKVLFPELTTVPSGFESKSDQIAIPTYAPALWATDKEPSETPPAFIKRVYGAWEGRGLTRSLIRQLDPGLYRALYNWLAQPGNELPADLDLPTKAEANDRTLERLEAGEVIGEFTKREFERVRSALRRRSPGKE